MNMDINFDYKRLSKLVNDLSLNTLKRLDETLLEIKTGHQLNSQGATIIPFNSRVEECLIFLFDKILFYNTNNVFVSNDVCNEDQCFLPLNNSQLDILNHFQGMISKRIKTLTSSLNNSQKNKLIFSNNGKIDYYSYSGKLINSPFKKETNEYKALYYLMQNKGISISFLELAKQLKPARRNGESATEESRVRDTIQAIRKKLKLTNTDNDIFDIENAVTLTCKVEL